MIPAIPDCDQECLYNFILNQAKFGVLILDIAQKKIIFKNQFFKTNWQGQDDQILNNIQDLINRDKLLTGEQIDLIINIDSLSYDIGISGYKLTDSSYLIFLKDISSKKISQERKNLNEFYLNFSKALAAISHEVGNPLSSIGTTLQIIQANIDNWESTKQKDYLAKTINEIKRITTFIKKVRNFTWDENLELKLTNLEKMVHRVIGRNELFFKSEGITVEVNIDPGINVIIDENAFYQVLFNLLNNSVSVLKDREDGKVTIHAEEFNENFIKLVYKNNGDPIDEEDLKRIFTLFFSTNEKGRGMGLAICLKLMALMGGTIKAVQPEDEIGAQFVLFIPLKEVKNNISEALPKKPIIE